MTRLDRPPPTRERRPGGGGVGSRQIEAGKLRTDKYPDPPRSATILTIPGRTAIVGGEPITIRPALRRCIARMRDGAKRRGR